MAPLHSIRPIIATVIIAIAMATGCDDTRTDSVETVCCDENAAPVFLMSKTDDDDGDGNILDEDFPTIDDEDDDIADHTWIRDDSGLYHLFFHTEDHGSGTRIEHYTTDDLQNLDYVGPALYNNPGSWDSYALWAPHVVRSGSTYYMFYTGTDGPGNAPDTRQRIGLATSSDLMNWTRYPAGDGCIYDCDETWTSWSEPSGSFNQQCRDPFVIHDPANQRWVLFATAKKLDQSGVITVAYSADLTDWTGAGFIDATSRLPEGIGGQTTGGQAENAHVMSHEGTYYLLFTDWHDPEDSVSVIDPRTITQYATSSTLAADPSGSADWIYRGYIPDPGVNAIEVLQIKDGLQVMSQSISNERSGYWDLRRQLRLKCVIWDGDFTFRTSNVKFHCNDVHRTASPLSAETSQ